MEREEINLKVKEILINVLDLQKEASELNDDDALFGTDDQPGLFDDSIAVLEVTSVMMGEFDIEASAFNDESFKTIKSLTDCIYEFLNTVNA